MILVNYDIIIKMNIVLKKKVVRGVTCYLRFKSQAEKHVNIIKNILKTNH